MAKIKTPLLSFRANGSIAGQLTFAQTASGQIAKSIPSHRDARTLPQLYQRWRFRDACYYWRSLSNAARQAYKDLARPLRMTGWTYFLSIYLSNPLDQVLWLHLDEASGGITKDYSGKGNDGTIFGAVPATGVIDGAYRFDGIDDLIDCPSDPTLDITDALTAMAWIYPATDDLTGYSPILTKNKAYRNVLELLDGRLVALLDHETVGITNYDSLFTLSPNTPQHVAVTFSYLNDQVQFIVNGNLKRTVASPHNPIKTDVTPVTVGNFVAIEISHSIIDDPRLYTRPLSLQHIKEIATTQYWPHPVI